jgi:hypothetical protein
MYRTNENHPENEPFTSHRIYSWPDYPTHRGTGQWVLFHRSDVTMVGQVLHDACPVVSISHLQVLRIHPIYSFGSFGPVEISSMSDRKVEDTTYLYCQDFILSRSLFASRYLA